MFSWYAMIKNASGKLVASTGSTPHREGTNPYFILDFIEQTNQADTQSQVFSLYVNALKQIGFDQVIYTFITDHPRLGQKSVHGAQCSYPQDWMRHYTAENYYNIDPVIKFALQRSSPFTWEEVLRYSPLSKKQSLLVNEAKDAGLNNGVCVPLYGACGEIAGTGLATSAKNHFINQNMLSQINLLTQQFHVAYGNNSSMQGMPQKLLLTPKETEIVTPQHPTTF